MPVHATDHQQKHTSIQRTEDVLSDLDNFDQLHLPKHLLSALHAAGFTRPSPVQQHAIPIARLGLDVLVQSKSGTGKTLVYAITTLLQVDVHVSIPQVWGASSSSRCGWHCVALHTASPLLSTP